MTNTLTLPVGERLKPQKKQWDPPKWMYPILYNKWKILAALLAVFLLISVFSFGFADDGWTCSCGTANEGLNCTNCGAAIQKVEHTYRPRQLGFALDGMIKGIFANDAELAKWIKVDSNLKMHEFSSGKDIQSDYITPIYNVFASVGLVLTLMFWGMGYLDMIINANGQTFLENIVRKFVLLIIALLVVTNAKTICCGMLDIVNAISDSAFATDVTEQNYAIANTVSKQIKTELDACTWVVPQAFVALGYVVQMFFPWLISIVAGLGVKVYALARYLEICIVTAISPVLFADVSNTNGGFTHSAAFRGIKQVLALALQGVVILVGLRLCGAISSSIIAGMASGGDFLDIGFGMVAVGLAQLGITAKSQQISRQLVGLG